MDFAHYSQEAAHFAAELINTKGMPSGTELLPDLQAWKDFLRPFVIQGSDDITERDVEQIRVARERLREVFFTDEPGAIALLNAVLRDLGSTPQIVAHDGHPWHMHYSEPDAPIAHRIASGAAMGLATLITESGFERLGVCTAENCLDVFVDTSRNRSRRYCDSTCATKVHVAAHRARKKELSNQPE